MVFGIGMMYQKSILGDFVFVMPNMGEIISKPLTHNKTISENNKALELNISFTARYAAIGDRASPNPNMKWQNIVNRLV